MRICCSVNLLDQIASLFSRADRNEGEKMKKEILFMVGLAWVACNASANLLIGGSLERGSVYEATSDASISVIANSEIDPQLLITNLILSAGSVTVEWNQMSDRHIVVASDSLVSDHLTVASSASPAHTATFPYNASSGFFRTWEGLSVATGVTNPVLMNEVRVQASTAAPTNEIYDVDLPGIIGLTLPAQSVSIAELGDFTNLDKLSLAGSDLTELGDVSPLSDLTWLNLSSNQLSSVTSLAVLTGLEALDLQQNQIIDLSGIEQLIHLRWLDLEDNQITDLTMVVTNAANGGLGESDELWVRGNPLSATATNQIEILKNTYNVKVLY